MIASQGNLGQEWFGSLKVATQSALATERKIQIQKYVQTIQKDIQIIQKDIQMIEKEINKNALTALRYISQSPLAASC